jgi:hypothetical protein
VAAASAAAELGAVEGEDFDPGLAVSSSDQLDRLPHLAQDRVCRGCSLQPKSDG